ncbi:hypothetical protein ASPTUDRAFT_426393 [Aspergillus tubingensis CBS 134.48]|uniref:Uncharacterized protein n=1 Tax=Aspergillus tubingensis (strain CBS 134.48) TaxID=767770 RepID=A0A1L9NFM3_ASPTC|nr:hypothetical protein ASPTUDRAFT_426393 [Aspergillus tubingensis CBS 134.48]
MEFVCRHSKHYGHSVQHHALSSFHKCKWSIVHQKRSQVRVRIIDKLGEVGVSEGVFLPQVINRAANLLFLRQSPGYRSPIASDLCTRHATQIVLRRSKLDEGGAKISIIPGHAAQADGEMKERLLSFE